MRRRQRRTPNPGDTARRIIRTCEWEIETHLRNLSPEDRHDYAILADRGLVRPLPDDMPPLLTPPEAVAEFAAVCKDVEQVLAVAIASQLPEEEILILSLPSVILYFLHLNPLYYTDGAAARFWFWVAEDLGQPLCAEIDLTGAAVARSRGFARALAERSGTPADQMHDAWLISRGLRLAEAE